MTLKMGVTPAGLIMRACWHIAVMLLLAQLAGGCANRQRCAPPCTTDANCYSAPIAFDCHAVERRPLVADISQVSHQASLPPQSMYCNLPEKEAQCLATLYAPHARLLEAEADALAAQAGGHHRRGTTETTQQILRLQAVHERNRTASVAVQLLLNIAGAESAADRLRQQLEEVAGTIDDLSRMQSAGVDAPVSHPETQSQQSDAQHKLTDVELTIDLLSEQLSNLIGAEPPPGARYWPDVNLTVDPTVPELEQAQMTALAQRADLAALRLAASTSGRGSLNEMRTMLGQTPGLGLTASGCRLVSLFHPHATGDEAAVRQQQIEEAVAEKERSIRHEVRQAVATIEARLGQIALARQRLDFLTEHRNSVLQKAELTPAARFEVRKASVAVLIAEQDVFHDVIEWKTAVVKLREALGELAIECGYMLVFDYTTNCCP